MGGEEGERELELLQRGARNWMLLTEGKRQVKAVHLRWPVL